MKKLLSIFVFACLISSLSFAQRTQEQIESVKIGLITQKLELTPEQSKSFWPVYNKYSSELQQVRKEIKRLKDHSLSLSDDELTKEMDKMFTLKEKELEIEKRYHKEFSKILSTRQVFNLYQSENQYRRMLIEGLRNRRNGQDE
jgi:Skp family chaperone for outer membrane proteins